MEYKKAALRGSSFITKKHQQILHPFTQVVVKLTS